MPTYQYACRDCDHRFEAVQSFSDGSLTDCPACAGKLRKVFSSVGIVFKGTGFYRTDSRSGGTVAKSESADSGGSNSSSKVAASSSTDSGSSSASSTSSTSSGSTATASTSS